MPGHLSLENEVARNLKPFEDGEVAVLDIDGVAKDRRIMWTVLGATWSVPTSSGRRDGAVFVCLRTQRTKQEAERVRKGRTKLFIGRCNVMRFHEKVARSPGESISGIWLLGGRCRVLLVYQGGVVLYNR